MKRILLLAAFPLMMLWACGGDDPATPQVSTPERPIVNVTMPDTINIKSAIPTFLVVAETVMPYRAADGGLVLDVWGTMTNLGHKTVTLKKMLVTVYVDGIAYEVPDEYGLFPRKVGSGATWRFIYRSVSFPYGKHLEYEMEVDVQ